MGSNCTRRSFINHAAAAGAALSAGLAAGCARRRPAEQATREYSGRTLLGGYAGDPNVPKVLLISIDSLDPRTLELNSRGQAGGRPGDYLMPNVNAFLAESTTFGDARCFLPSATDMNHLNAVAGGHTGLTGIFGISLQQYDWLADGSPNLKKTSLSYARDDQGRPVDTLFAAFKRRWPHARTLYAAGKGWVAGMFRTPESGVDLFLTGDDHPAYIQPPGQWSFYDPPTDADAADDVESRLQRMFCNASYGAMPTHFPCDNWTATAALELLRRERPDLAMILLAQMDDAQHGLGAPVDPAEYATRRRRGGPAAVSRYNRWAMLEPALDAARDVDQQFAMLIDGIRSDPYYRDALIVLYSDHGHVTHRDPLATTFDPKLNTNALLVLHEQGLISDAELGGQGVYMVAGSSVGGLYIRGSLAERRRRAGLFKQALERHAVWDALGKDWQCPWIAADIEQGRTGIPGVSLPGELYHPFLADNNEPGELLHPDLVLLMRERWQLPVRKGLAHNLGARLPWFLPDGINIFVGGHGSYDTARIVMAFNGPGVAQGRALRNAPGDDQRIADIAVTVANRLGLELRSTTIGHDRSAELG